MLLPEDGPEISGEPLILSLPHGLLIVLGAAAGLAFVVFAAGAGLRVWVDAVKAFRAVGADEQRSSARERRWGGLVDSAVFSAALAGFALISWAVLLPLCFTHPVLVSQPGCEPGTVPTGTCSPMADLSKSPIHWGFAVLGVVLLVAGCLARVATVERTRSGAARGGAPRA